MNGETTKDIFNKKYRGHLDDARFSGTTADASTPSTGITGSDETSPTYYTVRYYMRVNN